MGAAGSSFSLGRSSTLTGKQLRDDPQAKDIEKMSNELFSFMYSNYNLKDIFDIANNPGEYVIAISDLITAQFNVLGYTTKKNKLGEIYFKKWTDLIPPQSLEEMSELRSNPQRYKQLMGEVAGVLAKKEEAKRGQAGYSEHEQHAKIIAFYFVRIFQILGALLLVVKDSRFPEFDEQGSLKGEERANASRAYAGQAMSVIPKFKPPTVQPTQRGPYIGGGYIDKKLALGPYEFLRKYIRTYDSKYVDQKKSKDSKFKIPDPSANTFALEGSSDLYFTYIPPANLPPVITKDSVGKQVFQMLVKKGSGDPELVSVSLTITDFDTFTTLDGYKAPSEFSTEKQFTRYPRGLTLTLKQGNKADYNVEFRVEGAQIPGKSYEDGLPYRTEGPPEFLRVLAPLQIDKDKDFVKVLEVFVFTCINIDSPGNNYKRYSVVKSVENSGVSNSGKTEAPKGNPPLEETYKELIKKDHYPHCIARALDLLDAASINGIPVGDAKTKICASQITDSSKYQPLKSLGQLFGKLDVNKLISVDTKEFEKAKTILGAFVDKSSEGVSLTEDQLKKMGQVDEAEALVAGINKLSMAFDANKKAELSLKSFRDIPLGKTEKCKGSTSEQIIKKGGPEFLEMQRYSQQLLAFHLNSVINISKFLKVIFNVKQRPDGSWKVEGPNTELLFAGFDNLDELTKQARELLIDYYSGCETIYQKGVAAWVVPQASETQERVLKGNASAAISGATSAAPGLALGAATSAATIAATSAATAPVKPAGLPTLPLAPRS